MARGADVVETRAAAEGGFGGNEHLVAPSADRLFTTASKVAGDRVIAVVLTGMGDDGRRGVVAVKECGGHVIAESEQTAVIHGMPQQAIRTGAVDSVLSLHEMAAAIQTGIASGVQPAIPRETR